MSTLSQSDFDNWKADGVTKAFFIALAEQVGRTKEVLAQQAGLDSAQDNFYRGYIGAFQDALQFRVDDLQETE